MFLTAGDAGDDGTPIANGTGRGRQRKDEEAPAAMPFQTAAHLVTDAVVVPLTWRKLIEQDF